MIANVGRSRRAWCYHKRGISLDDDLGAGSPNIDEDLLGLGDDNSLDKMEAQDEKVEFTLSKRFGRILSCEEMADVHFIVGTNNSAQKCLRIPAHKLVLAVGSPVFKAMFFGPMAHCSNNEKEKENSNKDIELPDIEPIVFLEFLRYLYTDEIKLTSENVVALRVAAKKYDILNLEESCVEYLKYSIDPKNVLVIWQTSRMFDEKEFEDFCMKVIELYAHQVLLGANFLRLDHKTVCLLLKNDNLRIDEVNVFRAVARWGKNQCLKNLGVCPTRQNIRDVLGEAINLIRFPLMTEEQLNRNVASEGILEDDVLQTLLRNFKTWPRMENPLIFSNVPRTFQRLQTNLLTVQRFSTYDNQLPNHFTSRMLSFSVNQKIFLAGIGIFGPKKACSFYLRVSFSITKCGCEHKPTIIEQASKSILIKCDGSNPIINIKLEEPFEVDPDTVYDITAKISPTNRATSIVRSKFNPLLYYTKAQEVNYYYGVGGQKVVEMKLPDPGESVVFYFSWNKFTNDETNEMVEMPSTSAPTTPNPPPRPPLPKDYRRPSTFSKLKRALSFTASDSKDAEPKQKPDKFDLLHGQIPVIMFYA